MSEHRPFTEDGARHFQKVWLHVTDGDGYAARAKALNEAFPQGLGAPKPAMRTTPVTLEECIFGMGETLEKLFPGQLTAVQILEIDSLWRTSSGTKNEAINTVLGLREPEPPLVTLDDARQFMPQQFLDMPGTMEMYRKSLEKFVRSKLPAQ